MVVLEEGSMLTTGHNQYLQPDYLSPLPTTVSINSSFEFLRLCPFRVRKYGKRKRSPRCKRE